MRNRLILPVLLGLIPILVLGTLYAVGACEKHGAAGCAMCEMKEAGECVAGATFAKTRALTAGEVAVVLKPAAEGSMLKVAVLGLSRQHDPTASVSVQAIGPNKGVELKRCGVAYCGHADLAGVKGLLVRVARPGTSETVYFGLQSGTASCPQGDGKACVCAERCKATGAGSCSMMDSGRCKEQGACKQAGATCPQGSGCGMRQAAASSGCAMKSGGGGCGMKSAGGGCGR